MTNPISPSGPSNITPSSQPGSTGANDAAARASVLSSLSTTAAAALSPAQLQSMTPQQINTYWLLRLAGDMVQISYTGPSYQSAVWADLDYIQANCTNPLILSQVAQAKAARQSGTFQTFFNTYNVSLISNLQNNPDPNFDFINLPPDSMMNLYIFCMGNAAYGDLDAAFWGNKGNNTPSFRAIHFSEFIASYFYQRNLNPDGTLNEDLFHHDMRTFKFNVLDLFLQGMNPPPSPTHLPFFYAALNGGDKGGGGSVPPTHWNGFIQDFTLYFNPSVIVWPYGPINPPTPYDDHTTPPNPLPGPWWRTPLPPTSWTFPKPYAFFTECLYNDWIPFLNPSRS